jgi:hypothetical protein
MSHTSEDLKSLEAKWNSLRACHLPRVKKNFYQI